MIILYVCICISLLQVSEGMSSATVMSLQGRRREGELPHRSVPRPGKVNIERKGPQGEKNDYICCEEGCGWQKKQVGDSTARKHAKTHSTSKACHIFEAKPPEEVITDLLERKSARNKRHHDKKKEEIQAVKRQKPQQPQEVSDLIILMMIITIIYTHLYI